MTRQVLVYLEINDFKIEKVSKEIISHAVNNFSDAQINAVVLSDSNSFNAVKDDIEKLPINKLYIGLDNFFDEFNTCVFADALAKIIEETKPDIFLMGATENGRDLAPRTASKLNIGLTADCTDLQVGEDFNLLATRPTYGGQLMATIVSKTRPNFATVRTGAFKQKDFPYVQTEFIYKQLDLTGVNTLFEVLNCEKKTPKEDWTCSEIIVAGGLGLKNRENFELIYKLAEQINAKPAASRAAVEMGWADSSIQVGQTGHSVSPKLYIAFGISGAMQHLAGITNSDRIIAVNIDKTAPIMQCSDKAIAADAVSILKALIEKTATQALL